MVGMVERQMEAALDAGAANFVSQAMIRHTISLIFLRHFSDLDQPHSSRLLFMTVQDGIPILCLYHLLTVMMLWS